VFVDRLLWLTDQGQVYAGKGYEVPEMSRTARGTAAVNVLELDDDESIAAVVPVADVEEGEFLVTVSERGSVKRTTAEEYENVLSTGIIAAGVDEDDAIVDATVTDGTSELLIESTGGMAIRFDETEARSMGRTARGVGGIELEGDDRVAGIVSIDDDEAGALLTVTRNGYGKRTDLSEYRVQSRYGKGLVDIDTGNRNGPVRAIAVVDPEDHLVAYSETGQIMRTRAGDISTVGRNTMGVIVMDLEDGDRLADLAVLEADRVGDAADEPDSPAADQSDSPS
jgi:DNA gyrase subunit A